MKKIFTFLLAAACCFGTISAFADEPTKSTDAVLTEETVAEEESASKDLNAITVMVNGTELVADVPAQIINDRTMLPMRAIFESLGAEVTWMAKDQRIFATKDTLIITMQIGNTELFVSDFFDGDTSLVLDVVPQIADDRTLVPVRAVSEALGCRVDWDGETRTVTITE